MIDLRDVEPLNPKHGYNDPESRRYNFSCTEMEKTADNFYQCTDDLCRLKYKHFVFLGYFKDPQLPYPAVAYPQNIQNKPMVCRSGCALLVANEVSGLYACSACSGNFMRHPEYWITSTNDGWLKQDPRVLKYLIKRAQDAAQALREMAAKNPQSLRLKFLLDQLDEAEKIFLTDILSHCRL